MQYENFGKFIRDKRKKEIPQMSLNEFAIFCEIEPSVLSRIETQKQNIKLSILSKIAEGFNLKLSELLNEYEKTL